MGYYIDLSKISLDAYRAKLDSSEMLPSRRILKEKTVERFAYLKSIGIKNVKELQQLLKKKDKLAELAKVNCFSEEYLVILLREINSIQPKPNKLKEFSNISSEAITELEKLGIKDTVGLFEKVRTIENRKQLAKATNISDIEILELTKLTDLSRIKWVGATFARMLYDVGVDNTEKASKVDYVELHKRINQYNKENNFYKGQIGQHDIQLFVEAAKEVSFEIEYQ